jgi:hypothetical protein
MPTVNGNIHQDLFRSGKDQHPKLFITSMLVKQVATTESQSRPAFQIQTGTQGQTDTVSTQKSKHMKKLVRTL